MCSARGRGHARDRNRPSRRHASSESITSFLAANHYPRTIMLNRIWYSWSAAKAQAGQTRRIYKGMIGIRQGTSIR